MDKPNIKEFKRLLFEGPVEFTFTKRDGTLRPSVGTMAAHLLPKSESGKRFVIKNIKEADGAEMPKRVSVFITDSALSAAKCESDAVTRALCESLGIEFAGTYEYYAARPREKKEMPKGQTLFYDLERKGYRSLADETLVSFKRKA